MRHSLTLQNLLSFLKGKEHKQMVFRERLREIHLSSPVFC